MVVCSRVSGARRTFCPSQVPLSPTANFHDLLASIDEILALIDPDYLDYVRPCLAIREACFVADLDHQLS